MKTSNEFIMREIAGEYVLVPIGKRALTFQGLVTMNEVGALIWHKEAVRVVQSLPKWIPGKQNGRNVPVYYTCPIVFRLQ